MASEFANRSMLVAGTGNIGSPLATLIARAGVGTLRLVDRDRVEAKNVATQDFAPQDVGRFKAEVLAERLTQMFPAQTIEAYAVDIEDLPLGLCQVDVLLGALDSRRARQVLISEIAWPLSVPVVDGGVGEGLLGRVQVFVPGPQSACLECTWGQADYRQLAAEYPCFPGASADAPPTVSPAFAGTVVAGLMTAETVRLLSGERPEESHEIAFDLKHRHFLTTRLRRAPGCRFDHEVVAEVVPLIHTGATCGDLLAAAQKQFSGRAIHLECRRRNGFTGTRYVSPEQLRRRAEETLASLGFVPGDRVRVRSADQSILLALEN